MDFFLQLLTSGVCLGFVYALVTVGFVLIFKCSRVFNIAQGSFVLIGSYIGWTLLERFGLPVWLAFLAAIAIGAIIGLLIEHLAIRPVVAQPLVAPIMITIALLYIFHGIVVLIWGAKPLNFSFMAVGASLNFGNLSIAMESIVGLIISVTIIGIFLLFFRYTKRGLAMRATAEDEQVVQGAGVRVNTVYALAWIIACVVGVLAGILFGSMGGTTPALGETGLKALAIALVGGFDSIGGCVVAALIVGILENLSCGYLDPLLPGGGGLASVFPFIIMIIVLIFKPYGLFGLVRIERI